MKYLIFTSLLASGCSAYMVEPDWQTGMGCWRFGVEVSETAPYHLDQPEVLRLSGREVEAACDPLEVGNANRYACYDLSTNTVYLNRSPIFTGRYEEFHERCHRFGIFHNGCAGVYAVSEEDCT